MYVEKGTILMTQKRRTFVAGHNGLVGTAVCKALANSNSPPEILTAPHAMLNLEDSAATLDFFKKNQPEEAAFFHMPKSVTTI